MPNKKTLTVGIAAYNEENTITSVIEMVLAQTQSNFILEEVIIISDGSTDATVDRVKALHKSDTVTLVADPINQGRAVRLKQLYDLNQSQIIVILDADIYIKDPNFLAKLVSGFTSPRVGIVSSNNQPIRPETLIGKIWYANENLWYQTRRDFLDGINAFNNSGCGVALEKEFAKHIFMPPETIADHQFVYINSLIQKKRFVFKNDAVVYYIPPSTWHDIQIQYDRSLTEDAFLAKTFDDKYDHLFTISRAAKLKGLRRALLQDPFYTLASILLVKYLQYRPKQADPKNHTGRWERTASTKKLIKL